MITGVSGSGKSTLAFDIIFNEGQRRYLESLNAYARQFVQPAARPDVDAIYGIPPTVAIEQRTSRGGRKSTVATLTEIYHFLRLLYVKLGTQFCPDCDVAIEPQRCPVSPGPGDPSRPRCRAPSGCGRRSRPGRPSQAPLQRRITGTDHRDRGLRRHGLCSRETGTFGLDGYPRREDFHEIGVNRPVAGSAIWILS